MTPERYKEVGHLYRAALELESAHRAAYLAAACGGDEALRQEVESLLGYEAQSGEFIDQPALEVAARAMAGDEVGSLVGQSVGHCRIISLLGVGGMGEVWLAEDTQLGRKVAVKLLPAGFTTQPERVRRFELEARAASALNHPNIITIYEIGEAEGTHYIVTEFVEGETLRRRMADAPHKQLKLSEALDVAAQIAAALSAAHEAGIAHRDIKPENVMVRRDGYVKVLDFGLAKLTEPSASVVETQASKVTDINTESGMVMGTPRYMSPEQARGEKMDARTDIFSLGVVLYEMVAGQAPFAGVTTSDVIAALLKDEPPPLAGCAPETPTELERIVSQALQKNSAERYQTASTLLGELNDLRQKLMIAESKSRDARAEPAGTRPRALSLIRNPKSAIRILAALAVLVIAASAAWFYFNRKPALTEKDTILLADFDNKTGEEIFDAMLKQGLAIQLQQSPFLNLLPETQMRHELTLMRRQPNERVTAELAREICERQNLKAFIAGSLAPLGSHYVITLAAVNGQSGEPLANEQVQAESREQVLDALSRAATRLRKRLGESLSSIERYDRPLAEGTTARPEAFKAYSQANELAVSGRLLEAFPFYQRAVELDRDFAQAYSQLAIIYLATGQPELAAGYAQKSYKLKDRAGELEKSRITQWYHGLVTGDLHKRIETLMMHKRTYPREAAGLQDLSSTYNLLGRSDEAGVEARESIRLSPQFAAPYRNLTLALLRLNRFAEAKTTLTQALQRKLGMTDFHLYLYQLAFIDGDTAGMQQQLDWASGKPEEYVAFDWQAGAAVFAGQWRKAQGFSRRAIDLAARGNTKEVAARYATEQALRSALFGDCRQARTTAVQGLKLARGRASLPRAALALALCGEASQAKLLIDELTRLHPEDTLINEIWLPAVSAAIALQRGDATQAIEQLQTASRYEAAAEFWPQYLRGQAYLKLGRGAEAAAEFQKILNARGQAPLSVLYPLAQYGLARAALLTGDAATSRKAYQDFLALWKDADGDLPVLGSAKKDAERLR
ncbi:MAG TPA: protein kinase [Blastocatellia bacterium]|nr:protein kinase [Blastocatellia bacterium]